MDIMMGREDSPLPARDARRQLYTISQNTANTIEDNVAPLVTSATILHVQKAVPEGLIVRNISLAALRKLNENKKLFAHQTDQEKNPAVVANLSQPQVVF